MENLKHNLITLNHMKNKKYDKNFKLLTTTLQDVYKSYTNNIANNMTGGNIDIKNETDFLNSHTNKLKLFKKKYFSNQELQIINKFKSNDKTI
tara:strand:- start:223 stop:501 length:279 start_codon:yes stop_codon:yes gene_type:complete